MPEIIRNGNKLPSILIIALMANRGNRRDEAQGQRAALVTSVLTLFDPRLRKKELGDRGQNSPGKLEIRVTSGALEHDFSPAPILA